MSPLMAVAGPSSFPLLSIIFHVSLRGRRLTSEVVWGVLSDARATLDASAYRNVIITARPHWQQQPAQPERLLYSD